MSHTQLPLLYHPHTSNLWASAWRRWLGSGRVAPDLLPHCQRSKGLLAAATSVRQELSERKVVAACTQCLLDLRNDILDNARAAHGSQLPSE